MAKTIEEWKVIIRAKIASESELAGLTSTSDVADWNLWVNIAAYLAYMLESLFDFFTADVDAAIAADKSHTYGWYSTMAKKFQYGVILPEDSDVYAVVPPVDDSVLIVTSAATVELPLLNKIRIKVAKGAAGAREALDSDELAALNVYMARVKDAGVRLECTTGNPDDLKLGVELYYDPLVLNSVGQRLDGTSDTPVLDAVNVFLSELPFNGVFVLNDLIDAMEAVEGVRIAHVTGCYANYAATPYVPVAVMYTPDAGYMTLNETYFTTNVVYIPNI